MVCIASAAGIAVVVVSPSFADSLLVSTTPASAGMGGAYGAVAADNGAILLNPAGMSAAPRYGAETAYLYNNPYSENRIDVSVVDSVTAAVGVGVGFYTDTYHLSSLKVERDTYALALSMGEPGIFSAGITGRMDQFTKGISGSSGTLGYGVLFSPDLPFLNISLAALNVTKVKGSPEQLPPRLIDVGISMFLQGMLTLAFDAIRDLDIKTAKNVDFHLGGEVVVIHQVALRGGYAWRETTGGNDYSAGLAWKAPRFTLSYTFVGGLGNQYGNTQLVSFTVYPF
ncbi:MAG: hypothetical protein M1491_09260 [Deltaproteobacteria bacterium]|nr:hypothetical protein [Deltaproteobacteria bacterium]MCL5276782.1 hypothetical protein [Deltaproteobacteria bacterium]